MVVITAVFLIACRAETILPTPNLPAAIPADWATQAALSKPPTPMITPSIEGETAPSTSSGQAVSIPPTSLSPQDIIPSGAVWRVSVASNVPDGLAQEIETFAGRHPDQFIWVGDEDAEVVINLSDERPFATWIYVAAAPFAEIPTQVSLVSPTQNRQIWYSTRRVASRCRPDPTRRIHGSHRPDTVRAI